MVDPDSLSEQLVVDRQEREEETETRLYTLLRPLYGNLCRCVCVYVCVCVCMCVCVCVVTESQHTGNGVQLGLCGIYNSDICQRY